MTEKSRKGLWWKFLFSIVASLRDGLSEYSLLYLSIYCFESISLQIKFTGTSSIPGERNIQFLRTSSNQERYTGGPNVAKDDTTFSKLALHILKLIFSIYLLHPSFICYKKLWTWMKTSMYFINFLELLNLLSKYNVMMQFRHA